MTDKVYGKIKAVPTVFRGVAMRSRTEARWAVFFDDMCLDWIYEPRGYLVNGEFYLPDFLISDPSGNRRLIEVKGAPELVTRAVIDRCVGLAAESRLNVYLLVGPPTVDAHTYAWIPGLEATDMPQPELWRQGDLDWARCDECGTVAMTPGGLLALLLPPVAEHDPTCTVAKDARDGSDVEVWHQASQASVYRAIAVARSELFLGGT